MRSAADLSPGEPIDILLVSDGLSATQSISFGPLDELGYVCASWDTKACARKLSKGGSIDDLLPAILPGVVIVSRCVSPASAEVIAWARRKRVPVVYHIDDDLLDVPDALGPKKYAFYHDPSRKRLLRDGMEGADLIYASTAPLANRLKGHGITTPIIAGEIYCSVDPKTIRTELPSTTPVIGYMGSSGHARDLATIIPAIARLLDARPALSFELFGTIECPPELERFGPRVRRHAGFTEYRAFLNRMRVMGWWVGLAPLEDNPFNRCKADTKWVEYAVSGCAVVAQDLPVYDRACADCCGLQARHADDWEQAIAYLLDEPSLRRDMVRRAQTRLSTHYTHDMLRAQVTAILAQLHVTKN